MQFETCHTSPQLWEPSVGVWSERFRPGHGTESLCSPAKLRICARPTVKFCKNAIYIHVPAMNGGHDCPQMFPHNRPASVH